MIQFAEPFPLQDRIALAEDIRNQQPAVAEAVTDDFFERHPDWKQRYGNRGRVRGVEDANFHIDFLRGAIETGSEESFGEYVRWAARMLEARRIGPEFLAENLEQIRDVFRERLQSPHRDIATRILDYGARVARSAVMPDVGAAQADQEIALAQQVYVQSILVGNRRAAVSIANELFDKGHTLREIYMDVLQQAMYEVGRLWERNRISVAEEHMATAITQFVIAQLYQRMSPREHDCGRVVITGVQGELHQVGANMVADVLEEIGWDVRFLGSNMPHTGILSVVEEFRPALVGISATMLFNVPQVRTLVAEIRSRFKEDAPRIVVGGAAFRTAPHLYKEIGADGFASDLRELTAQLEQA